ncbi:MAG: electron transfer flavoprotein subunit alpha/FixB family protein [Oscillospiraceae bacterium]|nr:electron transfer flavoprotein subunit alpha/FixB family protein [Oscillospiraceae bacterium]
MAKENYKGIWIFAEQQNGVLEPTVFELLAKAQELKAHNGEEIVAVLLGCGVAQLAPSLIAGGADKVIVAENEALAQYSARPYQQALTQLAEKYMPSIILYGATSLGRDLAPRMMISLKTGLTADAIDLGYDEDDVFFQTTPAYGGSILAHIVILECRPQMSTVRPKMFEPLIPDESRTGEVITENVTVEKDDCYEVISVEPKVVTGIPLDKARVIVSGGRGVKSEEELNMLRELASLIGAQLGAARPLVDCGFLPHDLQIGQSGVAVKPEMIINVALSGSVQYQVGMQSSKCIASINYTAGAPIFDISHYGVVADFKSVVPAIIEEIKNRKA